MRLSGGGTHARVEFRDDELCETALQFNTMVLNDRQLKINRPSEWTALKSTDGAAAARARRAAAKAARRPGADSGRHGRSQCGGSQTVVSNLAPTVTGQMLRDLFTAALQTLPGEGGSGCRSSRRSRRLGRVGDRRVSRRDARNYTLQLFNGMELCGRPMQIAALRRP